PDMKLDRLKSKWVEFDTPEEWYNLPDGSVIVIDEAQRVFGNDGSRARPEKVTRFETHRHQGLDIHLITQHPSLLCTPVRKLVGKHINFIRPYGREKGIFRHE
ncbi:zonular occludens toxin, partial [Pseudomonas aeruginosa]|nr:zonular occludens toxin [Pseudomonas aeruginosa]